MQGINSISTSVKTTSLKGKVFIGRVLKGDDPLMTGKYKVYIPELMDNNLYGVKYIYCKNLTDTFTRYRDPIDQQYYSYGSYTPLMPGTKVIVTFTNDNFSNGIIIAVDSDVKHPRGDRDNYFIIYKTPNGSECYVDQEREIFHIQHSNGLSNIKMSPKDITFQINAISEDGKLKKSTAIIMDDDRIRFVVKDNIFEFGTEGFKYGMSDATSNTFIEMTKDTININANKTLNLSSNEGKISIRSQHLFLNGFDETHILANDLRLSGSQKAQLSGTTVNIQSWLDTHIKGMNISLDSLISIYSKGLISDAFFLGYSNKYSSLHNNSSIIDTTSSALIARSSSVEATDGFILSGIGIGASVSSSISASLKSSSIGIYLSLMGINTTLLMNEPTGIMAAVNGILTKSIAGSARDGIGGFTPTLPELEDRDPIVGLINNNNKIEKRLQYNTIPSTDVKLRL